MSIPSNDTAPSTEEVSKVTSPKMLALTESVRKFQTRVEENYWVELPDGGKIERWKHYNVARRVAQAACNYGGYIVTGTRHYCPLMCLQLDSCDKELLLEFCGGHDSIVQGFTDQYGMFITREEAYDIAEAAGQIIKEVCSSRTLFSENIV